MKLPYELPYDALPKGTPYTQTKKALAKSYRKTDDASDSNSQMVWVWTWGRKSCHFGKDRLQRGRDIAWQGKAELFKELFKSGNTSWNVRSSNGRKTYVVRVSGDGKSLTCECKDEPPGEQHCKHRYAVAIELLHKNYNTPWEELSERQKELRLNLVLLLQAENKPNDKHSLLAARRQHRQIQ